MNDIIEIIKLFRPSFEGRLLSLGSVLLLLPFGLQIVAHGQFSGVNFKISTENPYEIAAMVIGSALILIAVTLYWINANSNPYYLNKLGTLSRALRKDNPSDLEIEEAYYKEYGRRVFSSIITLISEGPGALQRLNDLRIATGHIEASRNGLIYTTSNVAFKKQFFAGMYFCTAVIALITFITAILQISAVPLFSLLLAPIVVFLSWSAWQFLNIAAGLYAAERLVKAKPPTPDINSGNESINSNDEEPPLAA
ncbi:MAG: hypothetical protein ACRBB4_15885 [Neptuniibacter sp.]